MFVNYASFGFAGRSQEYIQLCKYKWLQFRKLREASRPLPDNSIRKMIDRNTKSHWFSLWIIWKNKITISDSINFKKILFYNGHIHHLFAHVWNWFKCWPRRLCVRNQRGHLQCIAGNCFYHSSVFPLSFLSVFCFWPTSGKLLFVKICFPQYFCITRIYMQKKKCNFYFFTKKNWFFGVF